MDFTEPLFYVISVLSTVAVSTLIMFYNKLAKRYDWLDEISSDDIVNEYIMKGVMYAKSRLNELAEEHGKDVDIHSSEATQEILQYVVDNAPKALKKVGFSEDYLLKLIKSYLAEDN